MPRRKQFDEDFVQLKDGIKEYLSGQDMRNLANANNDPNYQKALKKLNGQINNFVRYSPISAETENDVMQQANSFRKALTGFLDTAEQIFGYSIGTPKVIGLASSLLDGFTMRYDGDKKALATEAPPTVAAKPKSKPWYAKFQPSKDTEQKEIDPVKPTKK